MTSKLPALTDPAAGAAVRSARRLVVFRSLAVLLGLLGALALGELSIRLWMAWTFRGRLEALSAAAPRDPQATVTLGDLIVPTGDADLIYRFKPGACGLFQGAPVRINTLGFRMEEFPREKPRGEWRALVLGDSNTFGWGVAVEDAYCSVLERALRAAAGDQGPAVRVINTAAPGYNAVMEAAMLATELPRLRPDVVLVQYSYNDGVLPDFLAPPPVFTRWDRLFVLDWAAWVNGYLADKLDASARLARSRARYRVERDAPGTMDPAEVPPEFRHHVGPDAVRRAYETMRRLCSRANVPLLVVLPAELAYEWDAAADRDPHYDQIRRLVAELDLPLVDTFALTRAFVLEQGILSVDLAVSDEDWHPNPVRHSLMAQAILPELARRAAPWLEPAAVEAVLAELRRDAIARLDAELARRGRTRQPARGGGSGGRPA